MAVIAVIRGSVKARGRGKNTPLEEEGRHINETFLCHFSQNKI